MAASITPVSATTATASVTPVTAAPLALQPGTVVSAQVMLLLENGLAQIAIDGLAIAALSEVPLQVGDSLQLAVSQAADGVIKLSILPQAGATSAVPPTSADIGVTAAGNPEAVAVANATQAAAPRQQSLSPLFANLPVVVTSDVVPAAVQAGASQLLALRPELTEQLSASDLRTAFDQSGLFLEATLASGAAPAPSTDLKAALVTFRDAVSNWLATSGEGGSAAALLQIATPGTLTLAPSQVATSDPTVASAAAATPNASLAQAAVNADAATLVPAAAAEATIIAANVAPAAVTESFVETAMPQVSPQDATVGAPTITSAVQRLPSATNLIIAALEAAQQPLEGDAVRGAPQSAVLASIKALQAVLSVAAITRSPADAPAQPAPPPAQGLPAASTPPDAAPSASAPPPFRGAAPAAQPIAQASLAPEATPKDIGRHLLEQTDGAIARQTLLQVASLPDRVDSAGTQFNAQLGDTSSQRWNFEIPFGTPQGTALAQFEIERDGGGNQVEASSQKVWRARFTLNVEPTGPVHALVSLIGDKTAVRMWAERPETAARIRAQSSDLVQALRLAELEPGDIVIAAGVPPQAPAKAGHFLDRAS
jgi:hypothetical protein